MTDAKLVLSGVSKSYAPTKGDYVEALDDFNLEVREGEFVALVGPSGCGKSTLLRLIAGLDVPDKGTILLNGQKVEGPGADRGMVSQGYGLFPWLNVRGNVEFGLRFNGVSEEDRMMLVNEYVRLVGLSGFEGSYPAELSGGMQQRVALARTMVNDPDLLLLDEPFGALDSQTRSLMQELLLDVWQEKNKTVLLVTHDVDEALFLADTVYVVTAAPCSIKAKIDVNLPRPRTFDMKTDVAFMELRRTVHELAREESLKAMHSTANRRTASQTGQAKNPTFGGVIKTILYDQVTQK